MMDYDIVWILTYESVKYKEEFLATVEKFMKAKKSLYLWSDNQPLFYHTNEILINLFDGMHMTGDYYGDKTVSRILEFDNLKSKQGFFDGNHKIFYGVNSLFEGITICHPEKIHPDFKVIAYNTSNEPLIIIAEENENHGRIVLDCGFTKLYDTYWQKTAGTCQYVSNANVWLTGVAE